MFGTSIPPLEDMEEMNKKLGAKRALGDALLDLMLCTVASDEHKVELQIMKEYSNIARFTQEIVEKFAVNTPGKLSPELIEAQKAVRDYLGAVAEGLKQYLEETVKLTELNRH